MQWGLGGRLAWAARVYADIARTDARDAVAIAIEVTPRTARWRNNNDAIAGTWPCSCSQNLPNRWRRRRKQAFGYIGDRAHNPFCMSPPSRPCACTYDSPTIQRVDQRRSLPDSEKRCAMYAGDVVRFAGGPDDPEGEGVCLHGRDASAAKQEHFSNLESKDYTVYTKLGMMASTRELRTGT